MSAPHGYALRRASVLAVAPEDLWARVGTIDGANLELAPWLRMTAPRHVRRLEDLPTGVPAFRSWLLLLGLVPVDRDEVRLVRVDPLHGFLERSRLLSAPRWEHERTLERHAARDAPDRPPRRRGPPRAAGPRAPGGRGRDVRPPPPPAAGRVRGPAPA